MGNGSVGNHKYYSYEHMAWICCNWKGSFGAPEFKQDTIRCWLPWTLLLENDRLRYANNKTYIVTQRRILLCWFKHDSKLGRAAKYDWNDNQCCLALPPTVDFSKKIDPGLSKPPVIFFINVACRWPSVNIRLFRSSNLQFQKSKSSLNAWNRFDYFQ